MDYTNERPVKEYQLTPVEDLRKICGYFPGNLDMWLTDDDRTLLRDMKISLD